MAHENRTPQTAERASAPDFAKEKFQATPQPSSPLRLQRAYADPSSLTPSDIKHLQRTIGNRATIDVLSRHTGLQAKLKLGPAGDQYEQEADRVAQQVVRQMARPQPVQRQVAEEEELQIKPLGPIGSALQRKVKPHPKRGFTKSGVGTIRQAKSLAATISRVQRAPNPQFTKSMFVRRQEEEEELQRKPLHGPEGGDVEQSVERQIQTARGGGKPLDDNIRGSMEQGFGADFSGVRVHTGGQADALNRSLNAKAFTVGNDVFFGKGQYNPGSSSGQQLIAHELTHTVQQSGGAVQRESSPPSQVVQAKFVNAKVTWGGRTTFRSEQMVQSQYGDYQVARPSDDKTGNSIKRGTHILVDDSQSKAVPDGPQDVLYRPAININIKNENRNIPANKLGWVKEDKVSYPEEPTVADALKAKIGAILKAVPRYGGLINTAETRQALLTGAVRYENESPNRWGDTSSREAFARSLSLTEETVLPKIREGAIFTDNMLHHWKTQLGRNVTITRLKFTESDLHEHGLGVVFATFRKRGPATEMWRKFAGNADEFQVVLKPEDKSLERDLLGSQEGSVANRINEIAGLDDLAKLTTIKMETSENYGSMIEMVAGESMESKAKRLGNLTMAEDVSPAFYETMTFAFIAGIGDLHKQNIMYGTNDNKPYLIDADNVIEHDQMEKQNFGANVQSGFGQKNRVEAEEHRNAMRDMDFTYDQSTLFTRMLEDDDIRDRIFEVLRQALAGKTARVVPVATATWASNVNQYKMADGVTRTGIINNCAREDFVVRGDNRAVGAGLIGNCYVGAHGGNYDVEAEKRQLKTDFDGGIIPFYNYDFDTGEVWHNTERIYNGQTVNEAINNMKAKFEHAAWLKAMSQIVF